MKSFVFLLLSSVLAYAADFATGQAARLTIGQRTFTAQDSSDTPNTASAYTLGGASGLAYANNTLFVTDANRVQALPLQNRVLIYNNINGFVLPPAVQPKQGERCNVCAGSPDVKQADVVVGQTNFAGTDLGLSQAALRLPTAVASDGQIMAVADTDNNRVLIWKTIPQTNGMPADIVLGQADFKTVKQPPGVDNKSFRGPQGVWIQGTRFFVADTQNHRVMVWNNIPTTNNQPADYVLGQPNFFTAPQPDLTKATVDAHANNMLNPVSVTSDGVRLLVSDLGHNRVLLWNSIPTQTQQPADLALGQPDTNSAFGNNSPALCPSNGTDTTTGKPTYPQRCGTTLSFPRFALSDGTRLYLADGGNDRVLVYNTIPTQSGAKADVFIGQPDEFSDNASDTTDVFGRDNSLSRSAADTVRTPMSLAWDGANLYVSDPFDRRVLVYTPGQNSVPVNGITNAASRAVFALGSVTIGGAIKADDTVTITIAGKDYLYKVLAADTIVKVIDALIALINASGGDPNVIALSNAGNNQILLTSKLPGTQGNGIAYAAATSASAMITAVAAGSLLNGGQNAADVAPGTIVSITGTNLSDVTAHAEPTGKTVPSELGGVQVFFDGNPAPILYVSPTQINTQVPFGFGDASSISAYVVTTHSDGTSTATTAVALPIVLANPGIFAIDETNPGPGPRPALAFHVSANAIAVIDVGGMINTKAGDVATIMIEDRSYAYSVQTTDTLTGVRDALITLINANPDEKVTASAAGQFTRIILTAKAPGADGNGIAISVANSSGATIALTALQTTTCCATSTPGAAVTADKPALPGELISIYATGLGQIQPDDQNLLANTGQFFQGSPLNFPSVPVDDAQVGGETANVLNAGLKPGLLGVYEVQLQLAQDLPTNLQTQVFIAQDVFTSNIVTLPVVNPNPVPATSVGAKPGIAPATPRHKARRPASPHA
ncbi:MAG: IPT/TIG domain-containing protein [Bryobacteraceae bacterium]